MARTGMKLEERMRRVHKKLMHYGAATAEALKDLEAAVGNGRGPIDLVAVKRAQNRVLDSFSRRSVLMHHMTTYAHQLADQYGWNPPRKITGVENSVKKLAALADEQLRTYMHLEAALRRKGMLGSLAAMRSFICRRGGC